MIARTDDGSHLSRRRGIIALWGVWAVTRGLYAAVLLKLMSIHLFPGSSYLLRVSVGDVKLYQHWGRMIAAGSFPTHDPQWQYPPLAAVVMLLPRLSGGDYLTTFVVLMVLVDAPAAAAARQEAADRRLGLGGRNVSAGAVLLRPL
jgi:hypothetical protein